VDSAFLGAFSAELKLEKAPILSSERYMTPRSNNHVASLKAHRRGFEKSGPMPFIKIIFTANQTCQAGIEKEEKIYDSRDPQDRISFLHR